MERPVIRARIAPAEEPSLFHGALLLGTPSPSTPPASAATQPASPGDKLAHLTGIVGMETTVTLEIQAEIPSGASEHVVRTVTENGRTLKFTSQGFEAD